MFHKWAQRQLDWAGLWICSYNRTGVTEWLILTLFKISVKHSKALKRAHNHRYASGSSTSRRHQHALESSTCLSTLMNQGHYLIKLLVVFVKILTDCESLIDIRLSNYLSRNVKDYHPAFSLCLNWFKRHMSRVLKVSNCKDIQCALVSVYISVGLRYTMTRRSRDCHFWTCFAMSKPKETMSRIRFVNS